MKNKIKDFSDIELFMVILFDEMKIQQNLVCPKYTDDFIDFVDLGDLNLNYATLQETNAIVPNIFVYFCFEVSLICLNLVWPVSQIKMHRPVKYSHCSAKLLHFVKHGVPLKLLLLHMM